MTREYIRQKGLPRPLCKTCNKNKAKLLGKRKDESRMHSKECDSCLRKRYDMPKNGNRKYRKHKRSTCFRCDFTPEHTCQLDVDHIDGNKKNNNPNNLQTLCANCHRLKTQLNEDYKSSSVVN